MTSIDQLPSKSCGVGESFLNAVIYLVTFQWAVDILSFFGSLLASDIKMKAAVKIDIEAPKVREEAKHVDAFANPQSHTSVLEQEAPKIAPVEVDQGTKKILELKASTMRGDLVEAYKLFVGKTSLTPEEFQSREQFIQSNEEHLAKYPFLADTKETGLDQLTFRKLLDKLKRQLAPFVQAKKEVVEQRYSDAKKLLEKMKAVENPGKNALIIFDAQIQVHERILEKSPHVGSVREESANFFNTSFSYKKILTDLRNLHTQLAG